MKIRSKLVLAGLILGVIALATPALADHHGGPAPSSPSSPSSPPEPGKAGKSEPSPEDRAKMADAHQKMAECLRSTRPMKECRAEMMKKAHDGDGHGKSCKNGDACDGSGKHHGHHSDGHGEMLEKDKGVPKVDAEKSDSATPKTTPPSKPKKN